MRVEKVNWEIMKMYNSVNGGNGMHHVHVHIVWHWAFLKGGTEIHAGINKYSISIQCMNSIREMNEKLKNNMKFLYFVSLDWLSSSSSTGNTVIENPMRMKLEKWIKPIEEKVESAKWCLSWSHNRHRLSITIEIQSIWLRWTVAVEWRKCALPNKSKDFLAVEIVLLVSIFLLIIINITTNWSFRLYSLRQDGMKVTLHQRYIPWTNCDFNYDTTELSMLFAKDMLML